jgi:hypothetical protein
MQVKFTGTFSALASGDVISAVEIVWIYGAITNLQAQASAETTNKIILTPGADMTAFIEAGFTYDVGELVYEADYTPAVRLTETRTVGAPVTGVWVAGTAINADFTYPIISQEFFTTDLGGLSKYPSDAATIVIDAGNAVCNRHATLTLQPVIYKVFSAKTNFHLKLKIKLTSGTYISGFYLDMFTEVSNGLATTTTGNGYELIYAPGTTNLRLRKKVAGVGTSLVSDVAWVADSDYHILELKKIGSTISALKDGSVIATVTDTTFTGNFVEMQIRFSATMDTTLSTTFIDSLILGAE